MPRLTSCKDHQFKNTVVKKESACLKMSKTSLAKFDFLTQCHG